MKVLKAVCSMLLCGALSFGCDNGPQGAHGCIVDEVVLDQCVNTNQCRECTSVCEEREGTRAGGPQCTLFIGFGFFCTCQCEFCFEEPDAG